MTKESKPNGRPLKWATPEELKKEIDEFFDHCKIEKKHPIVERLCVYLGCDKQTILNYEEKDGFAKVIENAKLRIASHVMGRALDGDINPTMAIWISKNHYGYSDTKVNKTDLNVNGHEAYLASLLGKVED